MRDRAVGVCRIHCDLAEEIACGGIFACLQRLFKKRSSFLGTLVVIVHPRDQDHQLAGALDEFVGVRHFRARALTVLGFDQAIQMFDPRLVGRMAAVEEVFHCGLVAMFLQQLLEGLRRFPRVVAGFHHVFESDYVGLSLGGAPMAAHRGVHRVFVGLLQQRRRELRCRPARGGRACGNLAKQLDPVGALDALGDMALGDMRQLVAQHHLELRFVLHPRQQPGVHVQITAAESKGVEASIAHNLDAVAVRAWMRNLGQSLHQAVEIGVEKRVIPHLVLFVELGCVLARHALLVGIAELRPVHHRGSGLKDGTCARGQHLRQLGATRYKTCNAKHRKQRSQRFKNRQSFHLSLPRSDCCSLKCRVCWRPCPEAVGVCANGIGVRRDCALALVATD